MKKSENCRQGNIEIMRFIVSLIIVTFHLEYIGIDRGTMPFSTSWIYVEFFFALTGYFTLVHFERYSYMSLNEKSYAAITYTIKKFLSLYPYVFISLTLFYLVKYIPFANAEFDFDELIPYFYDVTLLTGCFNNQKSLNGVLWFLSALFIVYPLFSLVCQMKEKNFFYILSFYITLLFYGYFNEIESTRFPMSMIRAMAGLFLGGIVYGITNRIKKVKFTSFSKLILTMIEIAVVFFVIIATYKNKDYYRVYLVCFVIFLSIMLSNRSYTSIFRGRMIQLLGKISMVIYIFHPLVGFCIQQLYPSLNVEYRIVLYYVSTVIISLVVYVVVETIKKKINFIGKQCREKV